MIHDFGLLVNGGFSMADKQKYWTGVLYPENMVEGWEDKIGDLLQVPYAYCIHDKDLANEDQEQRKVHMHLVIAFPNTTTSKHALDVMKCLGAAAINTCKPVNNINHIYNYLIHDTEDCKKKKKHLYDKSERITGNNFDIGSYEQLTQEDKDRIMFELEDMILEEAYTNYTMFYRSVAKMGSEYRKSVSGHASHFYRLIQGNYLYKNDRVKKFE